MRLRRASAPWLAGLVVAFLLVPRHGAGSPVSEATARLVARNFMAAHVLAHGSWNGVANPAIASVTLVTYQGTPVAYNVVVSPSGHLLVACDDEFSPVLLYSDRSSWDPRKASEPDTFEAWIVDETHRSYQRLKEMDAGTRSRLRAVATRESAQVSSAWDRFGREEGRLIPRAASALATGSPTSPAFVGPLLTVAWDQGTTTAPFTYNLYTPPIPGLGGCVHTYAGCTATAVAQLMKFWNWPPSGTGSRSYSWHGQMLSTDFTRTYNWANMPVSLYASSTATQIDAVARLMYDVGISIEMDYSCTGSAASVSEAAFLGLPNYFRYRHIGQSMARKDYTGDQFFRILKADVELGRPLLLEVYSATAGHAVVIDGYQVLTESTSQVHVNLGWGGSYTGWYDVTNNWSTGYYWIASTQVAYRGIEPDDGVVRGTGAPVLLGPTGTIEPTATPTFTWAAVPGATHYRVIAYQGWSDPANPATGSVVYRADSITAQQAGCPFWDRNCSFVADGAIPAGVPTAFTVGAANDTDPAWADATPYFQFTIERVGPQSAGGIGQLGATMTAAVNPFGHPTSAYFEYGVTTGYGNVTSTQDLGSGTTAVTLTASVDSLTCGTTYHYRAVVIDSGRTSVGADATFTTLPCGAPVKVAAGYYHTCVLMSAGGVVCWGANDSGQLGDGTTTARLEPVTVTGLATGVAAIAAGSLHACAVTTAGGAECWGENVRGAVGDGTAIDRPAPVPVTGLAGGVATVTAGAGHTCALTTAGGVMCWGYNGFGQLGDGTRSDQQAPVPVAGLATGVATMAAGGQHSCAVTTAGGAECWGENAHGAVGDGTTINRSAPVPVTGLASGVATIAVGGGHSCAVTTAGGVACWGDNTYGQLGDGTTANRLAPAPVAGLASGVTAIAAGSLHTCALTAAGGVMCWGFNSSGELGDGTTTNRLAPVPVTGLATGVAAIAIGTGHTCAVTAAGVVMCWGLNDHGQLGDGTTLDRVVPTAVTQLEPSCVLSIAPMLATSGFGAGSQTVSVTAAPAVCKGGDWTASGNGSWLTVTPASGSGSGSVTVSWIQNPVDASRSDVATIAGSAFRVTQAGVPSSSFTDDPLAQRTTPVKALHLIELRQAIDALRARHGLVPFNWTDSTIVPGVTPVRAVHLAELRAALNEVYAAAGRAAPAYSGDITAGVTTIAATHINELRAAVLAIW